MYKRTDIKVDDLIKSTIVQDFDRQFPELKVVAISEEGATGWFGLNPERDVFVTVECPLRGQFDVFIDTIISCRRPQ